MAHVPLRWSEISRCVCETFSKSFKVPKDTQLLHCDVCVRVSVGRFHMSNEQLSLLVWFAGRERNVVTHMTAVPFHIVHDNSVNLNMIKT